MLPFLLLLMIVIWGANFAAVKAALVDFPPLVFNALRLVLAAGLLLAAAVAEARRPGGAPSRLTAADWRQLIGLGVLGHIVYQVAFVEGVARTSVGNAALIFGCTPVTVSLMAAAAGHERIPRVRWAGAALSLAGIYAIVGHRAEWTMSGLAGDAIMILAMICWSLYSVASRPILGRHSPVLVTGLAMAIGASGYLLLALPAFLATEWRTISGASWALMIASSVLALAVAYGIWYTGVQRIGSSRTAIYTNLTPIVAMAVGAVWLDEPVTPAQMVGTAAVLAGVFVARLGNGAGPSPVKAV